MDKKEKKQPPSKRAVRDTMPKPDPRSLKDDPAGETICHADFSDGCVNEDTDLPAISEKEDKNEKH